ncbi:histidinol-phosphate transaminase [Legionella waltersii]|uniref:Histidinol-phosphate aminotransferase n=1 Tax=Legionella waltersii TaxID=66969 RepID=A0A0W1AP01_9GAMM|nr:histidinol-phosphate transaminase [Legionella waltersii]KTD83029.1 histidinol-phosphate aminotransferase [Legionella waltersii]SNV07746.1 histidinol-phosphate aminotransferase [Legionella waltersii]
MAVDFQKLPHPGIQSLIPYKPGKSIEELAREKGLSKIIKLASNENPLGCSPLALEAVQSISSQTIATYPSPINHTLMDKLAAKLNIKTDQLFLSNGSDYLFNVVLTCFALHRNKNIVTHDFAFSTYEIQANSLQIPVIHVPIEKNWVVNTRKIAQACTEDTSMVCLANPNNPTGLPIHEKDIKHLLKTIPESTLLVLDEAYYEFAADTLNYNSINWLEEHPNLIITRTFSKIYGMAGLRLGYAIAHPTIISILRRFQLPFIVNQLAMAAAQAAIEDEQFIQASLESNAKGMEQVKEGFQQLQIDYLPSACNFLTFDCKKDSTDLYQYLLNRGIIVRPLHAYKMNNYIRVTIGTAEQNSFFLSALNDYYS